MKKKSLVIALIVMLYDQLIKYIINGSFYYGKLMTIIPNFFYLTKVHNDGAAWSVLRGNRIILIVIGFLAFGILLWYQRKFKDNARNAWAFGLVYGGLVGNLIDRISLGYVVDYFKVNSGSYEFPIFNLADVAIVLGFVILIYSIYKGEDNSGSKSRRK